MGEPIIIEAGEYRLRAELNDTETARRLLEILPLEESANRWGEEIYFSIPVTASRFLRVAGQFSIYISRFLALGLIPLTRPPSRREYSNSMPVSCSINQWSKPG